MKKETIIALILGVFFGGVLAFFFVFKSDELNLKNNKVIAPTIVINKNQNQLKESIKENVNNIISLEITEPNNNTIVDTDKIKIKGKATKNSLIVIQSPINDIVFKNEKEDFSIDFPLALGENILKIVVYPTDKQARSQEKELRIYYLKEEL